MDGTDNKRDDTSAEDKGTSEKDTETFTQESQTEAVRKAKSDALAEVGRLRKTSETAVKAVQKAQGRIDQMIRDQEDDELKRAEGDTQQLSAIKERQTRRRVESDLDSMTQQYEGEKEKRQQAEDIIGESTKEQNAREIATRLDVDPKRLVKLAKYTDGSTEAIEGIAQELPKRGEVKTLKPDSNKTIGGKDWERVRDAYIKNPEDRQNTERYLEMRREQGR